MSKIGNEIPDEVVHATYANFKKRLHTVIENKGKGFEINSVNYFQNYCIFKNKIDEKEQISVYHFYCVTLYNTGPFTVNKFIRWRKSYFQRSEYSGFWI